MWLWYELRRSKEGRMVTDFAAVGLAIFLVATVTVGLIYKLILCLIGLFTG